MVVITVVIGQTVKELIAKEYCSIVEVMMKTDLLLDYLDYPRIMVLHSKVKLASYSKLPYFVAVIVMNFRILKFIIAVVVVILKQESIIKVVESIAMVILKVSVRCFNHVLLVSLPMLLTNFFLLQKRTLLCSSNHSYLKCLFNPFRPILITRILLLIFLASSLLSIE